MDVNVYIWLNPTIKSNIVNEAKLGHIPTSPDSLHISVVSAVLVDLPASSYAPANIYKHTNPLRMWVDRVLGQLSDIQVTS